MCFSKWLGTRKVGAKAQVKMELAEKREIKRNASDENSFEGEWLKNEKVAYRLFCFSHHSVIVGYA